MVDLDYNIVSQKQNKIGMVFSIVWIFGCDTWGSTFLVSNNLINNTKSININKKPRSKIKPSDHTPIELEII